MKKKLANFFTFLRIAVIFPIVLLFFINTKLSQFFALIVFVIGALSDFFDGYFARKYNSVSDFGKFIDPVADKLFVVGCLFSLSYFQYLSIFGIVFAIIISMREIFISEFRELYLNKNINIPVSSLSKKKTTFQMIGIGFLFSQNIIWNKFYMQLLGESLLFLAMILGITTSYQYFCKVNSSNE